MPTDGLPHMTTDFSPIEVSACGNSALVHVREGWLRAAQVHTAKEPQRQVDRLGCKPPTCGCQEAVCGGDPEGVDGGGRAGQRGHEAALGQVEPVELRRRGGNHEVGLQQHELPTQNSQDRQVALEIPEAKPK
eukprot:scaffold648896_cov45-Prasinocladus_malaysianus.AAC.1